MTEPKFKPGDLLQHILAPGGKLLVIERLTQQCYAGTQIHYDCRSAKMVAVSMVDTAVAVSINTVRFLEFELEPWKPLPRRKPATSSDAKTVAVGAEEGAEPAKDE